MICRQMINYDEIKDKRIALLLSGGVDSSVVLYEMVSHGLHPDCFYIMIGCCWYCFVMGLRCARKDSSFIAIWRYRQILISLTRL